MPKETTISVAVVFLCASSLIGCSREPAPPPAQSAAPAQTAAPAPARPAAAPAAVLASAQFSADPNLRCDLLEVKRVSGGALMIQWRLTNTAGEQQPGSLAASQPKPIYYDFQWDQLYYIDPAENKKYSVLTDSESQRILEVFWGNLEAGQQRLNWAKFPAPPATSMVISISIPRFAPFEDVPVSP